MLAPIVTALAARLALLEGVDAIHTRVPPNVANTREVFVYAAPGSSTPSQHAGRNGNPVFVSADSVVVEWHYKIAPDRFGEAEEEARTVIDETRLLIWTAVVDNRLGGQIVAISTVDTDSYGEFTVGTDRTFGFRLTVDIEHATET